MHTASLLTNTERFVKAVQDRLNKIDSFNYLSGKQLCIQTQEFFRKPRIRYKVTKLSSETQTEIITIKTTEDREKRRLQRCGFLSQIVLKGEITSTVS